MPHLPGTYNQLSSAPSGRALVATAQGVDLPLQGIEVGEDIGAGARTGACVLALALNSPSAASATTSTSTNTSIPTPRSSTSTPAAVMAPAASPFSRSRPRRGRWFRRIRSVRVCRRDSSDRGIPLFLELPLPFSTAIAILIPVAPRPPRAGLSSGRQGRWRKFRRSTAATARARSVGRVAVARAGRRAELRGFLLLLLGGVRAAPGAGVSGTSRRWRGGRR